jgi:hypothetical protein
MVEPFYNGQARIETHCGALQVIDEQNDRLLTLREDRGRGQKTEDKIVQELGAGAVDL